MDQKYFYTEFPSPIGTIQIRGTESQVHGLFIERQLSRSPLPFNASRDDSPLRTAKEEVGAFLAGERQTFSIRLAMVGTAFQLRVWRELLSIPYGQTKSYSEIAESIGAPRASRAVGSANRCNPLLLLVPCHRVIPADGSLGGYSGGLDTKAFLLNLETNGSSHARTRCGDPT